jgi:hypothetical protein
MLLMKDAFKIFGTAAGSLDGLAGDAPGALGAGAGVSLRVAPHPQAASISQIARPPPFHDMPPALN